MTLGEKIQTLRAKRGLSQEQLAEQITVSRQSISKWELNQAMPDIEYLIRLSEIFGVTIDSLVKDDIECNPKEKKVEQEKDENSSHEEMCTAKKFFSDTVFEHIPFPFVVPVFVISGLFGLHEHWNWLGKGKPNKVQRFPFPIIVGVIYVLCCVFGVFNWHPGWVIFLIIPVYYLIAHFARRYIPQ